MLTYGINVPISTYFWFPCIPSPGSSGPQPPQSAFPAAAVPRSACCARCVEGNSFPFPAPSDASSIFLACLSSKRQFWRKHDPKRIYRQRTIEFSTGDRADCELLLLPSERYFLILRRAAKWPERIGTKYRANLSRDHHLRSNRRAGRLPSRFSQGEKARPVVAILAHTAAWVLLVVPTIADGKWRRRQMARAMAPRSRRRLPSLSSRRRARNGQDGQHAR